VPVAAVFCARCHAVFHFLAVDDVKKRENVSDYSITSSSSKFRFSLLLMVMHHIKKKTNIPEPTLTGTFQVQGSGQVDRICGHKNSVDLSFVNGSKWVQFIIIKMLNVSINGHKMC